MAQWIERPPGGWEVMGSIPVGDLDFFFVPRSCYVDYNISSLSQLNSVLHTLWSTALAQQQCIQKNQHLQKVTRNLVLINSLRPRPHEDDCKRKR